MKNEKNEILSQSFLHSRLKKVPNDIEIEDELEHCEVDCSLRHRTRNKQLQYLVKWKDSEEQTLEPKYHFDTTECIDEYWQKVNQNKNNKALLYLTTLSRIFKIVAQNPIMLSLFLLCIICVADSQITIN